MFGNVNIGPVRLTNLHPFGAYIAITQDNGHAAGMFFIASSGPADRIGMIEIVVLIAIGLGLTSIEEFVNNPLVAVEPDFVLIAVAAFVHVMCLK